MLQVDVVVVKIKAALPALTLKHFNRQLLVLLIQLGQVRVLQGVRVVVGTDHRLHGQLGEAQVGHVFHVFQKIQVIPGIGAADVVACLPALLHQLLELGHDAVIAALALVVHAEAVMHFPAAVQAQHHIVHLLVAVGDHLIIQRDAIGGQGEAEDLVVLFF